MLWFTIVYRCLQRTASSVFGSLNPYSLTECNVNRLKEAVVCDWMASCPTLKKSIITSNLAMPQVIELVTDFERGMPLIVLYLKEKGLKDDGDSLVVRSSFLFRTNKFLHSSISNFWYLEDEAGWLFLSWPVRSPEVIFFPHDAWDV